MTVKEEDRRVCVCVCVEGVHFGTRSEWLKGIDKEQGGGGGGGGVELMKIVALNPQF